MKSEFVRIREFHVEKLIPSKFMEVSISYISKEDGSVTKRFDFNDTPIRFTEALLEEVKKVGKAFEIENQKKMRDKIGNIMIKLTQDIKNLSRIKEHNEFLKAFHKINSYKTTFPEFD